ncbi:MAG TPA: hypothetical protein VNK82_11940 [Terriglobales bacterium]|nr:hypothetical protein [Terriglobales bacterium]
MSVIRSLRPNLSREQALARWRRPGFLGRWLGRGPLRSLAEVYIPFRLYRVEIRNAGKCDRRLLALDSVAGTLDLYGFDHVPEAGETVEVETRNHPPPAIDTDRAQDLVVEKVRRLLFLTGFFRVRDLAVRAEPLDFEFHVPYWVGFFGRGPGVQMAVLDAVRGSPEGAKMRALLHDWLIH